MKWSPKIHIASAFVFFAAGDNLFSRLIAKICGVWSHAGVGFRLQNGDSIYFEALFAKGVQGPKPLVHLMEWVVKSQKRRVAIVELPIEANVCERKYGIAQTYRDLAGYGEWQLLAMWFFEKIGRRWGWHVPRSPGRVVCSEFAARVLWPEIPLTDSMRPRLDEVTPGSAWRAVKDRADVTITFYP